MFRSAHLSVGGVFRDSRGVVHTVSSADPLDDLPADAARAMQDALLRPIAGDLGNVLERCDAVTGLLERWQDAFFASLPVEVDIEEERTWAGAAGMSLDEIEAEYDGDDEDTDEDELAELLAADPLLDLDQGDPRTVLPDDLVSVLERELLLLPVRTRLEALVAAEDLVDTWSDLLSDVEKLLGHVLLRHGCASPPHEHVKLAELHADLHAAAGPGHASRG
jgi:hypothetical protein